MTDNTEEKLAILRKTENEFEKYKGEAYTLLGRFEAFNFMRNFLEFSELKMIERIKETKAYRGLWVTDKKTGEQKQINTLKEFCECLGISYETANNHLNYLRDLGEPLYKESMRLGVSNREMRRLRALPDDALTEIAKQDYSEDEDKTRLLTILSEYELKNQQQAETLKETTQKLEESQQNYEALSRVNENKDKRINQLDLELQKSKTLIETATPDEYGDRLRLTAGKQAYSIQLNIIGELNASFKLLKEHQEKTRINHHQFMSGIIGQLYLDLSLLAREYQLNDFADGDERPDWIKNSYNPEDFTEEMVGLFGCGEIDEFE